MGEGFEDLFLIAGKRMSVFYTLQEKSADARRYIITGYKDRKKKGG